MTDKFDTTEDVVDHAVSSLLDDKVALRRILTDVMTTVLELDVKREWSTMDNFTMTEGVHGMLAGYLGTLTPDLVHEVCEQAGIDPDNVNTDKHAKPERPRYCIEFGVDAEEERRCALEVGPIEQSEAALDFAKKAQGLPVNLVESAANLAGLGVDAYDREDGDESSIIVGATLCMFTDESGTIDSRDLY